MPTSHSTEHSTHSRFCQPEKHQPIAADSVLAPCCRGKRGEAAPFLAFGASIDGFFLVAGFRERVIKEAERRRKRTIVAPLERSE